MYWWYLVLFPFCWFAFQWLFRLLGGVVVVKLLAGLKNSLKVEINNYMGGEKENGK